MTDRRLVTPAPAPLEGYAHRFDGLFGKLNQRNGFRRYLEGLLLPTERHKLLTGLANTDVPKLCSGFSPNRPGRNGLSRPDAFSSCSPTH